MRGKAGKVTGKDQKHVQAAADSADASPTAPGPADEVAALNDRLLRLQADFDNFRKRTVREKNECFQRANESFMEELLPVLDSMGLAIEGAVNHAAEPAILDGFRLVSEQLSSVLAKFGLTPIDARGLEFDPNVHEAVSHLPSDTVADGFVMAQTRLGYMLGDRLLRAAQVVVSSGAVPDGSDRPSAALDGEDGAEPNGE